MKVRIVIVAAALIIGCSGADEPSENPGQRPSGASRPLVHTVNYPLAYFAERIGGPLIEVVFPVPRHEDPAFWKPTPEVIQDFQESDLIVLNGAHYAKWVSMAALPEGRTLDTSTRLRDRYLEVETHVTHSHGPGGDHAHGGTAFTTWLDFTMAQAQAAAIRDGIIVVVEDTLGLAERYSGLSRDLTTLDERMHAVATHLRGRTLIASHPVYQYLAARYELEVQSVIWEPDAEPTVEEWQALMEMVANRQASLMLWESDPRPSVKERLAAAGVRVVVFDPCANRPTDGDFLSAMRSNVARLEAALDRAPGRGD